MAGIFPPSDSPALIQYIYLALYHSVSPIIVVADDPQVKLLFNAELDFK